MAQEYYPEYEENEYYKKEMTGSRKNNNYKNAPIANVEKKLFICNNVTDTPNDFECEGFREIFDQGSKYQIDFPQDQTVVNIYHVTMKYVHL